jgi:phosphoglycolate phosphatase
MRQEYRARQLETTRPYPGIVEVVDELAARGIRLAVLTNKPHERALEVVTHCFGADRFDRILGDGDDRPPKPDPAGARLLLAELALDPARVAMVGDSGIDMETGVRAGLTPVGCLWGFREADELSGAGAEVLVGHPPELLDVLG